MELSSRCTAECDENKVKLQALEDLVLRGYKAGLFEGTDIDTVSLQLAGVMIEREREE